jgi:hypothetical protein
VRHKLRHRLNQARHWRIGYRSTSIVHRSGMRACAHAHGLLRAFSEDASGNGSPFSGVERSAVAVLLAGIGDISPKIPVVRRDIDALAVDLEAVAIGLLSLATLILLLRYKPRRMNYFTGACSFSVNVMVRRELRTPILTSTSAASSSRVGGRDAAGEAAPSGGCRL